MTSAVSLRQEAKDIIDGISGRVLSDLLVFLRGIQFASDKDYSSDDFYSSSNIKRLEALAQKIDAKKAKLIEHDIIED